MWPLYYYSFLFYWGEQASLMSVLSLACNIGCTELAASYSFLSFTKQVALLKGTASYSRLGIFVLYGIGAFVTEERASWKPLVNACPSFHPVRTKYYSLQQHTHGHHVPKIRYAQAGISDSWLTNVIFRTSMKSSVKKFHVPAPWSLGNQPGFKITPSMRLSL